MNKIQIKRIVSWLLFAAVALQIITGYGITQYRTVESLTLGILNKPLAFQIHNWLPIPLIILLAIHVLLNMGTWLLQIKRYFAQNK